MTRFTRSWRGNDPLAAGELNFESAEGVAKLTIARPSDGNRLTPEILAHLATVAEQLADSGDVHALVLIGAGNAYFSRGIFDPALRAVSLARRMSAASASSAPPARAMPLSAAITICGRASMAS